MSHYIIRCSKCDTVIEQCRCADPNKPVSYRVCYECKQKALAFGAQGSDHPPPQYEVVTYDGEGGSTHRLLPEGHVVAALSPEEADLLQRSNPFAATDSEREAWKRCKLRLADRAM